MRIISLSGTEASALIDRLSTHTALADLPRVELEWLASHGQLRSYETGELVLTTADEANDMIVQLSGRIVVYFGQAASRRHPMTSRAGSVTGLFPFSRLRHPPADVIVEEAAELVAIHRRLFPAMISDCPVLTESLVHKMLDRARQFSAASWQDEKVLSLGRLAAGLAHELNNPASAAASGAARLMRSLQDVGAAAHRVGLSSLSPDARAQVLTLIERCHASHGAVALSPIEHADRVERLSEWLEWHGADPDCAETLTDAGIELEHLDRLSSLVSGEGLSASVAWVTATAASTVVAADVERATRRIHGVVSAVRDFTHLDRAPDREQLNVARGLRDTVELLQTRARTQQTALQLSAPEDLPSVVGVVADLNQAWTCLIENALDAVQRGGSIQVCAAHADTVIVVTVTDDGPGIPEEIQSRVFDPFFTTKPVGAGSGLGLDIVRRVARNHGGEVEFISAPGRTEFRVRLPINRPDQAPR